jgi:hypothetical protein
MNKIILILTAICFFIIIVRLGIDINIVLVNLALLFAWIYYLIYKAFTQKE